MYTDEERLRAIKMFIEGTIERFCNILIKNGLQDKIFDDVVNRFKAKGLLLMKGTIVDSTLIAAPFSTKNADKKRDEDAHQTWKGNQWYFRYKEHIGGRP